MQYQLKTRKYSCQLLSQLYSPYLIPTTKLLPLSLEYSSNSYNLFKNIMFRLIKTNTFPPNLNISPTAICSDFYSARSSTPINAFISSNLTLPSALVNMSALYSCVPTYLITSSPRSMHSRMKWKRTSICLLLPCSTGFFINSIADLLSKHNTTAPTCCPEISPSSPRSQIL